MLFSIVIIFVICWLPATLVLTFSGAWTSMPDILWPTTIWLAFCNSSMNSIVYGVMNKNFRTGYLELLHELCCCSKRYKHSFDDLTRVFVCDFSQNPETVHPNKLVSIISCSCRCTCLSSPKDTASDKEDFNPQDILASDNTPIYPKSFRFPASNQLKGYGSGSITALPSTAIPTGDILRHRSSSSAPQARTIKPEELYNNEDHYITTKNAGPVWHYPPIQPVVPEVEYVYGTFSSGNSSIITIESTISDDSDYPDSREGEYSPTVSAPDASADVLNYHPAHRRHRRDSENTYEVIGSVHRPHRIRTTVIRLQEGDMAPIYEVPIPDGEGDVILPTSVDKTPVSARKKAATETTDDMIVATRKETQM